MRNRADRRNAEQKAKQRAIAIMKLWGVPLTLSAIGSNASTHCKPCSCSMCCNRRKYNGPKLSERLDKDDLN